MIASTHTESLDISRRTGWWLAAIVVLAAVLRLYMAVSTPLIYDEYQWLVIVDDVNLRPGEVRLPIHGDQHPPGQVYWSVWGKLLFGGNLLGYRLGSVVLGTLAVFLTFRLGARYFGAGAGLLAALMLATNEYMIGGVSRVCTEKSYLTFAVLSLLLFERAARRPTRWAFAALGASFGLGLMTKQTLILWAPVLAIELFRRPETRRLWRTAGPWLAAATCGILVLPDIVFNLFFRVQGYSVSGVGYQLSKLGVGWDWGPAALFCRALIFPLVEPALFDYPALTVMPGLALLSGAVAGLFLLRGTSARFVQVLGWSTFLFFSIFGGSGRDYSAFWWSDLSIVPFTLLTAAVVWYLPSRGRWALAIGLGALFLVKGVQVTTTPDNVFLPDVGRPADAALDRARHRQRYLAFSRRHLDHVELCRVGSWWLPAWRYYRDGYEWYRNYLGSDAAVEREEAPGELERDRRFVEDQLRRFPES